MNVTQSFKLAIKSLLTSKMRALLTMLGIIIGVASVIIIISLGNGMTKMTEDQFSKMGSNQIIVYLMEMNGKSSRSVSVDDMYALVEQYPEYLDGVSPMVQVSGASVRRGTEEFKKTTITGVSENICDEKGDTMKGNTLAQGRFLQYIDVERAQSVCVIGSYLEQAAFGGDALGKSLTINGESFEVVGVFGESVDSSEGGNDDIIYIPYTKGMMLNRTSSVAGYIMTSTSEDTAMTAKGLVENRLYRTYQSSDYYMVITSAEMMDVMNSLTNTLMVVLVAIAAISLLVGGIGIMNIMLVSVTERTREIGVRKSLGAKRRDIRSQFIIEAGTTSAIGGVIGILLGVSAAGVAGNIIAGMMETSNGVVFTAVPTAGSVLLAFGVSVGIGMIFGYLPANKAAKLNPIDALRYD